MLDSAIDNETYRGVTTNSDNLNVIIDGTSTGVLSTSGETQRLKAGTYTFNFEYVSGSVTDLFYFRLRSNGNSIMAINRDATNYKNKGSKTFTLTEETEFEFNVYSQVTGIVFDDLKYQIQITKSKDADYDFEAPKQKLYPIDLQGNTLAKVGDIKDLLNIGLDGSVSIENKITLFNLKDVPPSAWSKTGTLVDRYYRFFTNEDYEFNSKIMCNFFKYGNGEVVGTMTSNYGGAIGFAFAEKGTTEYADWLEFINNNDVIVTLTRYTAKTIQLPSIKPIKLFEGTNNFELVTNLDTSLAVNYRISNNKRLKALEQALLESGV